MAWTNLPTNYKDAVWSGLRKYTQIDNDDGTVSFKDMTVYTQKENSFFGAADANQMNTAMNELATNITGVAQNAAAANTAAETAASKATAAAASATNAANFASAAANAKSSATSSASSASTSASTASSKATAAATSATNAANSATAAANSAAKLDTLLYNNAGAHNSIYRGKNLGTSVTSAQYAAIKAGTFDDMYIGDYWAINGVTWRIAAFDYYYNTGNGTTADGTAVPRCTAHHVTIVPDVRLYAARMNETATTAGGYVGSVMYTASLSEAKTTINNAFGAAHILSHGRLLCNAVTDGAPTGKGWYFSTVELMTERNVTGARIVGAAGAGSISVDSKQFPLFVHNPYFISYDGYWLRDVATATYFVYCNSSGFAEGGSATYIGGVRPAFSIIG